MNELEVKNEKSLEERLDLGPLNTGEDIFVSELGIVSFTDYDGEKTEEMPFDIFIKRVSSNIDNDKYLVRYDKESNKFYLIENKKGDSYDYSVVYAIDINNELMRDYAKGKYYDNTLKLHGLFLRSEDKIKAMKQEKSREQQESEIIAKANSNHEELTPLEARIYLDHLKKQDRKNAKDIAKSSIKLTAVAGVPIAAGITAGAICFAPAALGITALASALGVTAGGLAEGTFNLFVNDSPTLELLPINHARSLVRDIKEKLNQRRNNKAKERELRRINGVDKLIMPNSVTIEEQMAVEPLELEDPIMTQFDGLIDDAYRLNSDSKNSILDRIYAAIGRYETRKKNIASNKNAAGDSQVKLREDTCREIAKFELEIKSTQISDSKNNKTGKEADLLRNKIDKVKKFEFQEDTDQELEAMMDELEAVTEEAAKTSAK